MLFNTYIHEALKMFNKAKAHQAMLGIKTDFQAMDEIQNYNFTCGFVWV
jgi:hypothetical protein